MNTLILAGLLKRVYNNFDMTIFDNRLKLQKFVYLMKAKGLNLGYDFKLYLWGPYSTELANDGFEIKNFESQKEIYFEDKEQEEKFKQFKQFFNNYKEDPESLEIASSIHLIKKIYGNIEKEKIKDIIKEKRNNLKLDEEKFKKIFINLKKEGLI